MTVTAQIPGPRWYQFLVFGLLMFAGAAFLGTGPIWDLSARANAGLMSDFGIALGLVGGLCMAISVYLWRKSKILSDHSSQKR